MIKTSTKLKGTKPNWQSSQFTYSEVQGKEEWVWNVPTLWAAAAKAIASGAAQIQVKAIKELERFEAAWLDIEPATQDELEWHLVRIRDADLEYPIILTAEGCIMDGLHRLAKAILMHHETIKVIQFKMTPVPDHKTPL